jgi:hypothetical protein
MAEPVGPEPLIVVIFPAIVLHDRIADLQTAGSAPATVAAEE